MTGRLIIVFRSLLVIAALIFAGCSKKEDVPVPIDENAHSQSEINEQVVAQQQESALNSGIGEVQASTFNDVIELWTAGKKDQAIKILLNIDWNRPKVLEPESIFYLSEAEFVKLPEGQRLQIQQKAMELAKNIRGILKFMVEQAKQKPHEIETYRTALIACGKRLSGDDQLLLIQKVGQAIVGYVEKELPR